MLRVLTNNSALVCFCLLSILADFNDGQISGMFLYLVSKIDLLTINYNADKGHSCLHHGIALIRVHFAIRLNPLKLILSYCFVFVLPHRIVNYMV